jgi:FAD/FMN-containing dehydrogenase
VILVAIDDLAALGDAVGAMRTHEPVAIELVEGTLLRLGADRVPDRLRDVEATLLASFEGPDEEAVRHVMDEEIRTLPAKCRFAETAVTPADRAALWRIRKAASPTLAALPDSRRSLQFIEDGCVPVEALGEYVLGVREAATTAGIDIVAFGHAGDEHLHVNALVDTAQPDFPQKLVQLFDRVTELVIRLGGTPTGEHGDGRLRASLTQRLYGHELTMLFRLRPEGNLQSRGDPRRGDARPGKSLEGRAEGSNDYHLKVGPRAATIPPDVAKALRHVERTGGWERSKIELSKEMQ